MPSYVYAVKSNNHVYINSSYDYESRIKHHMYIYKMYKKGNYNKISLFDIFDKYGIENCIVKVLKEFKDKIPLEKLKKIEGRYQKLYRDNGKYICVNKNIAGRSKDQYMIDNKKYLDEYKRNYYLKNRERIIRNVTKYNNKNRDKILEKRKIKVPCPHCKKMLRKDYIKKHIQKYCKKIKYMEI